MAKRFLDQLAKVPEDELSKDSLCMICHRDYGTDSADVAVRLPCNHHVGLECISTWLSPDKRDCKNSCPMCRRVFFDVINEEDEEEYRREVLRRVGQPPQEGHAQGDNPRWYGYFLEAAAEQYQESLTRARAFLVRNTRGRDAVEREERFRLSYPTLEDMESHIANQATAFRTLAVREVMLYFELGRDGFLPPLVGHIRPLNAEQLEALFRELQRRGAFEPDLHPFEHYEELTDDQMWLLHREEGESFSTEEGGYWSLSLA